MTETAHTRSRSASLGGLLVQLVAFIGVFGLGFAMQSYAVQGVGWYLLGGVPIWFIALLVFRQRELAALEALDLEALRREKEATGGGEALFEEEGGGALGFRVAEARLDWMQRWLVPTFSLLTAVYLLSIGIYIWRFLAVRGLQVGGGPWPELRFVPIGMVVLAVPMVGVFLLSRYTSGMGRVLEWQLLRGCGAYMLGNALALVAAMICLGVYEYTGNAAWEHALAYILPVVMVVVAIEMLVNFVLDLYRPRAPGAEPRAAFDSRLLGLVAEPGGIASSIAEAINYQFGFQVSQTWFYKLLERAFVPMVAVGMLSVWLLTSVVIVQPYERAIIDRWGRQLNAENPLEPGIHMKWPWPIETARAYNTGQLHQIFVGYERFDAQPEIRTDEKRRPILLWTDVQHFGLTHFDFLTCPARRSDEPDRENDREAEMRWAVAEGAADHEEEVDQPVHLIRMDAAIQYRIQEEHLDLYSTAMVNPERMLRDVAWEEAGRYVASSTVDTLLGQELTRIGEVLRRRISERVAAIGIEVVYVGVTNVHPEKTVAQAYRNVVQAEQEKVAAIRQARVVENRRLSEVAGEATRARRLALAVEESRSAREGIADTKEQLDDLAASRVKDALEVLAEHADLFEAHAIAEVALEQAREQLRRAERDYELGLGSSLAEVQTARERAEAAAEREAARQAALDAALATVRTALSDRFTEPQMELLVRHAEARVAQRYWDGWLERQFTPSGLGGAAAATLAQAVADRWDIEMGAAAELARIEKEREAYRAAPQVYKTRRLAEVLVNGMKDARKLFVAFDPGDRLLRVRFVAEDEAGTDILDLRPPSGE